VKFERSLLYRDIPHNRRLFFDLDTAGARGGLVRVSRVSLQTRLMSDRDNAPKLSKRSMLWAARVSSENQNSRATYVSDADGKSR